MIPSPFDKHRKETKKLAKSLRWTDVYHWLVEHGYFPESYVLPPCFKVTYRPLRPRLFSKVTGKTKFSPALSPRMCCDIHFPKTDLTDRTFGIIHPELHNDIAYHIARNWQTVVDCLIPNDSAVTCYSFPIPINSTHPGRVGHVRSGRMIYEFLWMTEEDLTSVAYRYTHVLRADIRNFYPSIYTHSISWAIHSKRLIRRASNRWDLTLLGNRLDRLFQCANDQKTNGIPIGSAVSDIVAEIIAAGVDRDLTKAVSKEQLECEMTRFKDDYRILVKSDADGRRIIKLLQAALKNYDLELADDKCSLHELPDGLFRPWVSAYHAVHPRKRTGFRWKEFRELYLAVLRIDELHPGTGVIDRFLADIVSRKGQLKVRVTARNLQKAMSMLLMLGNRRLKSFPKVLAIIESILCSPFGQEHSAEITSYLDTYLKRLSDDEPRNTYLISWIAYFLVSNNLKSKLTFSPRYRNPITRSVFNNRGAIFRDAAHFRLFEGSRTSGKARSMLSYLDVFNPPKPT
jgi:hypothetical protein